MKVIVVGSGAGGATAARELAVRGMDVTVLEAGAKFKPFTRKVGWTEPLRRLGMLGGTKNLSRFVPAYHADGSGKELLLVRGITEGGCTVVSCGNMVRAERGLKEIGLDLTPEFEQLERQLAPSPVPRETWRPMTERLFQAAKDRGMDPIPTPKAVDAGRCVRCGLCEVGCPTGARWDSRRFLREAVKAGCQVRTEAEVTRLVFENGKVVGVQMDQGRGSEVVRANAVVLAAGGIGTAQILRSSGISPSDTLWADIVLTIGGRSKGSRQLEEPPMVWFSKRDDYIISPYFDVLSHWFHRPWRSVGMADRVGVMVKLAEKANGSVQADGTVVKPIDPEDLEKLRRAGDEVRELMAAAGVHGPFVDGMFNGGHLGGTVPLRMEDVDSMHPSLLPENVWVADLSLLPCSQGLPTMMTAAALARRVAGKIQ